MLRRVQCTYPSLSWLAVLPLSIVLASCGASDSVTGPSVDPTSVESPAVAPDQLALVPADLESDGPTPEEIPLSDLAWDPVLDADYDANADGTMSQSCRSRKVKICYKGRTRKVARWKVKWYLRRGATRGRCPRAVTCPCFSATDIQAAGAQCASPPTATCGTGDPYYLFMACSPGGNVPPGVLGVYLSQTAAGGMCQRDDVLGTFVKEGLTEAEFQACVRAINGSGYC